MILKFQTVLLLVMFISLTSQKNPIPTQINSSLSYWFPDSSSYISHGYISVTNNLELANVAVDGNGSSIDPYILENWNITTYKKQGIYITNTTANFIIRNCFITTNNITSFNGIFISHIAVGTAVITNNIILNSHNGIFIDNFHNSTVLNNICFGNSNGISVNKSDYSIIESNICNYNDDEGIFLHTSDRANIFNNTCNNNSVNGICINKTIFSNVTQNICIGNENHGIYNHRSHDTTITDNLCNQNKNYGIFIYASFNTKVLNNTCSNNDFGIRLRQNFFPLIDNNTCNNNYDDGIFIPTSNDAIVANNTCNDNMDDGISIDTSWDPIMVSNICKRNKNYGIFIYRTINSTIAENICELNWHGISFHSSINSVVANNSCLLGTVGISIFHSSNSSLRFNTCGNTSGLNYQVTGGVYVASSPFSKIVNNSFQNNDIALHIFSSYNSTIKMNLISNSYSKGIFFRNSNYCLVNCNLFINNYRYIIYLDSESSNNTFHHNFIINDFSRSTIIYDSGINNTWYNNNFSGCSIVSESQIINTENYGVSFGLEGISFFFIFITSINILNRFRRKKRQ